MINWLNAIIASGELCDEYCNKVERAESKKQYMDIVLDINGCSFLPSMREKGYILPYETIQKQYSHFINGSYKADFRNEKGSGYSSMMYCQYDKPIYVESTLCVLLGCEDVDVYIPRAAYSRLFVDTNCDIRIHCEENARAIVEYWGSPNIDVITGFNNVNIRNRNK